MQKPTRTFTSPAVLLNQKYRAENGQQWTNARPVIPHPYGWIVCLECFKEFYPPFKLEFLNGKCLNPECRSHRRRDKDKTTEPKDYIVEVLKLAEIENVIYRGTDIQVKMFE